MRVGRADVGFQGEGEIEWIRSQQTRPRPSSSEEMYPDLRDFPPKLKIDEWQTKVVSKILRMGHMGFVSHSQDFRNYFCLPLRTQQQQSIQPCEQSWRRLGCGAGSSSPTSESAWIRPKTNRECAE